MKRYVDLQNPSSLEEAISLATQFESFDLGEGHGPIAWRGETRPSRGRTAHVQAEEQLVNKKDKCTNEELANLRKQIEVLIARESKAEKASKTIAELDQKVSKLTEQVESLTKIGLARTQSYQSNRMNNQTGLEIRITVTVYQKETVSAVASPVTTEMHVLKSRRLRVSQRVNDKRQVSRIQGESLEKVMVSTRYYGMCESGYVA